MHAVYCGNNCTSRDNYKVINSTSLQGLLISEDELNKDIHLFIYVLLYLAERRKIAIDTAFTKCILISELSDDSVTIYKT